MKLKKLKIPLKVYSTNKKKSSIDHHTKLYKKGILDVLKLNMTADLNNNNLLTKSTEFNDKTAILSSKLNQTPQKDKDYPIIVENENTNIGALLSSIKKLKSFYPNIKNYISSEKYSSGFAPSRIEHIKLEEYLKNKINSFTNQENSIICKKEKLEQKIISMDDQILDQQLNVDVINNLEKNNPQLTKNFEDEYIEKEFGGGDSVRHRRHAILESPDFQDKLRIYLLRVDYNAKQKIKSIEDKINSGKNEKLKLTTEMSFILEELKEVHIKKQNVITKLYNHFLNTLHDGKDTRNEGLSWVIREIFYLGKKIMKSNFPEYLDRNCIKYLYKMTGISMQIIDTEKKMQVLKEEFKKKTNSLKNLINIYRRTSILNMPINSINYTRTENNNNDDKLYLAPVNPKKPTKSKKCVDTPVKINYSMDQKQLKKKSPLRDIINYNIHVLSQNKFEDTLPYLCNDPNHNIGDDSNPRGLGLYGSNFVERNFPEVIKLKDIEKFTDMNENINLENFEKDEEVSGYFAICKKLRRLKLEKEKLKAEEMDRIFREFQKNNYGEKYRVDKNTVICALIGEDNLNAELLRQSRKEKRYLEELAKSRMHKKIFNHKKMMNLYNLNNNGEK